MTLNERKMTIALEILKTLKSKFGEISDPLLESAAVLGAYNNGREEGLSISYRDSTGKRFISWAENRNSDEIVVYTSFQSLSLGAGSSGEPIAKYFPAQAYEDISQYIYQYLTQ